MKAPRLATLVAAVILTAAAPPLAHSRLFESRTQCAARYGDVVRKLPASVPLSDPDADVYHKNDLDVIVHYRNGQAWHLMFARRGLVGADEWKVIFAANLQGLSLESFPEKRFGQYAYRIGPGGSPVAAMYRVQDDSVIEVMSGDCIKAMSEARRDRVQAAWANVETTRRNTPKPVQKESAVKPDGTPKDLRGF